MFGVTAPMADDESVTPIASSSSSMAAEPHAAEPHAAGDPSRRFGDEESCTEAAPLPSALRLTSILNASDADVVMPQLPLPTLFPLESRPAPVWLPAPLPSSLLQAPEPAPPSRMLQLIERLEAAPLLASVYRSQQSSLEQNGGGSGTPPPPLTYNRGAWTTDERAALLEGYRLHGRKAALLAPFVPTRSTKQIADYVSRVVRAEDKQPAAGQDDSSRRRVADDSGDSEEVTLVRVLPAPPPSPLLDWSADRRQSTATVGFEPQYQQMQDKGVELHQEPPQERHQQQFNTGHWTAEEKAGVLEGYRLHGATVSLLMPFVPTRSAKQISNYVSRMTMQDAAPVVGALDAPRRRSQQVDSHTRTTPAPTDSDSDVVVVTAVASATPVARPVVDLSADEPRVLPDAVEQPPLQERRSRRAVRSLKSTDASMTTSLTANDEAIEIHKEESASETPQTKATAPTRTSSARTRSRDQKPPLPSSKAASVTATSDNDSDSAPTATRQRKKSKLTVTIPRHALAAAKSTPESSSTASWTSSAKPTARGKKRPAGVEFTGIPVSTTAIVTATAALSSSPFEPRECEFCRSSYGVCALVHCALCKRVYHPKCVVRHFQPFCGRDDAPIEQQLAALQLHAPPHVKVKMFRCTSCYAMCVESFRSGVYEWACTCASCTAPEKLVAYRRRMLLHLMYGGGDAKPKTTGKAKDATTHAGGDTTTPAKLNGAKHEDAPVAEVRTGSRRRGRSTAPVAESELMEIDSKTPAVDSSAAAGGQHMRRDARATPSRRTSNDRARGGSGMRDDGDNDADDAGKHGGRKSRVDDAEAGDHTREQEATSSLADSGDADQELLASVAVRVDETTGTRSFPIVCTESASLTVSGLMKGGQYQLHSKRSRKRDAVCCDCCSKLLSCEQFVSHTDKNFLTTDGKAATDFLFASHRDGVTYSPLMTFVALLQQHSSLWRPPPSRNDKLETFKETKTKRLSGRSRRLSPPADVAVAVAPAARVSKETAIATASQLLAEAPIVRLRPSNNASSSKPVLLVKLVCLSPRLIIRMSDGVIQSKLDSSTPDQAFPYKAGWLSFDKGSSAAASAAFRASVAVAVAPTVSSSPVYSTVWCSCCATVKSLENFIAHTGIEDWSPRDDSKFRRHHVFVPQTSDSRMMVEFDKVWQAVLLLHHEQLLDAFLAGVVDEVVLDKRDQRE